MRKYFGKPVEALMATFFIVAALPAFADCPKSAESSAAQALHDIGQKRKTATEIGPFMALLAEDCKENSFVQLNAAQVTLRMHDEAKDVKTRYALAAQAWQYMEAYSRLPGQNAITLAVDGQARTINLTGTSNIRKAALTGLLQYDAMNVGHHPYLASGPAFPTCPKFIAVTDATTIVEWVRKRGAQDDRKDTGALRLLGRLVEACKDETSSLWRSPARYRAQIQMTMAERMKDQAEALKLARQAQADIEAYLVGEKTERFWQKSDVEKLSKLLTRLANDYHQFNNMRALPREDWFKAENLGSEAVIMAIGFAFDEKWAVQVGVTPAADGYEQALGGVGRELGLVFALATKSAHESEARKMMYQAMERHSKGRYRSPETLSLKPIPDFVWTWLDKEKN